MSEESTPPLPSPNCYTGTEGQRLDRIERKVDTMILAIKGDEAMGHKGIAHRLRDVETHAEEHNKRLVFATGFLAALVTAWELVRHKFLD